MAEAFIATHGTEVADIIMEHLPPSGWGELATRRDLSETSLVLRSDLASDMGALRDDVTSKMIELRDELKSDMGALRDDMTSKMTALRNEVKSDMGVLRDEVKDLRRDVMTEMSKLRSELTTGMAKSTERLLKWSVGTVISMSLVMVGGMTLVATIIK